MCKNYILPKNFHEQQKQQKKNKIKKNFTLPTK